MDRIERYKKWTQQYAEASEEISNLVKSPDDFFAMDKEAINKWKQAIDNLHEAITKLNGLVETDSEVETSDHQDIRNIGF